MQYPSSTVPDWYVFVNNKVIYNMSDSNDTDGCGVHVGYDDTEYEEGDDNSAVLAKYYPHLKIVLSNSKSSSADTKTKYLFLDYLITDGDTYDTDEDKNLFTPNSTCGVDYGNYWAVLMANQMSDIKDMIIDGRTMSYIEDTVPYYMKIQQSDIEDHTENAIVQGDCDGYYYVVSVQFYKNTDNLLWTVSADESGDGNTIDFSSSDVIRDMYIDIARSEALVAANVVLARYNYTAPMYASSVKLMDSDGNEIKKSTETDETSSKSTGGSGSDTPTSDDGGTTGNDGEE